MVANRSEYNYEKPNHYRYVLITIDGKLKDVS